MDWVFMSQKTTFFIVTAVNTSNLTAPCDISERVIAKLPFHPIPCLPSRL
jgi:hypothetical protein